MYRTISRHAAEAMAINTVVYEGDNLLDAITKAREVGFEHNTAVYENEELIVSYSPISGFSRAMEKGKSLV